MKFTFLILLMIGSAGLAQAMEPSLVPVNEVKAVLTTGCGTIPQPSHMPPPDCSASLLISFVVPAGGSCHTYSAKIAMSDQGNFLSIMDSAIPNCTRPEQLNFQTSVRITPYNFTHGASLFIQNPTYVMVTNSPRP